jgi:hypothetical protein
MYLLWITCLAGGMFFMVIGPDVANYFGLTDSAWHFARFIRRKVRQWWAGWRNFTGERS